MLSYESAHAKAHAKARAPHLSTNPTTCCDYSSKMTLPGAAEC